MARAAPSSALRRSQKPSEATAHSSMRGGWCRLSVAGQRARVPDHDRDHQERYEPPRPYFKPLLKRAELPAVRLHDLRHTCATILLMADKHPKYVQELLGHCNISITLDIYSHAIKGMDGGLGDATD